MLEEISRRTQELWRPSPGSLYPALRWLQEPGLIRSDAADGRRQYELTLAVRIRWRGGRPGRARGGWAEGAASPFGP